MNFKNNKATMAEITSFLQNKEMAIIGVSGNEKKFSRFVYNALLSKGYKIHPVNPKLETINGQRCYKSINEIPAHVEMVYIVTPKSSTLDVVKETAIRGAKQIWIQQMSETEEVLKYAQENNIKVITNECMMMFAQPIGTMHKFHKGFNKLFGKHPR